MTFHRLICAGLAFASAVLAHALEWESKHATIAPDPFTETTQVTYKFRNTGVKPVHITSAFSSCGCTVPHVSKTDLAPGESGEVVAVFTIGQVIGDKTREITVTTDEPADIRTYTLVLEARVPETFELKPEPAEWHVGDAPQPKTLTLKFARADVHPIKVEPRDPRLQASFAESSAQGSGVYEITITPTTTAEELYAPVIVTMNLPAQKPRVIMLYARITAEKRN